MFIWTSLRECGVSNNKEHHFPLEGTWMHILKKYMFVMFPCRFLLRILENFTHKTELPMLLLPRCRICCPNTPWPKEKSSPKFQMSARRWGSFAKIPHLVPRWKENQGNQKSFYLKYWLNRLKSQTNITHLRKNKTYKKKNNPCLLCFL